MFRWPDKIEKVGYNDVSVKYVSRKKMIKLNKKKANDLRGETLLGRSFLAKNLIMICREYSKVWYKNGKKRPPADCLCTLIHEHLHFTCDNYPLNLSEAEIDIIANEMTKLFLSFGVKLPKVGK